MSLVGTVRIIAARSFVAGAVCTLAFGLPKRSAATVPRTVLATTELAGRYAVHGTEPDGGPEESTTAVITRVRGNRYHMLERHPHGDVYAECLSRRASLVCAWANVGTPVALFVYRKQPSGELRGQWLDTEHDLGGEETLRSRLVATPPSAGVYDEMSGRTSDGTPYTGIVMHPVDRGTFRWSALGLAKPMMRYGRVLEQDGEFVAGANGVGSAGVVVYGIRGHILEGRWMDWSRSGVGTETLTRL